MAVYLVLTDNKTGQTYAGEALIGLDSEIATHLGLEPDPIEWTLNWMDTIGFAIAMGKAFSQVRELFPAPNPKCAELVDYLESRFG
jgi:hypothetical protein